jgi:large subunit ribosomal protein L22
MANAVEKIREFRAEAKFQRTSPQKVKLVLDLIKGLRVEQALNTVHFSTKRMAPVVEKVLRSAIQNATYVSQEQGLDVDVDNLYVRTAVANEGPRMKRIRPAPMGRAFRYQRLGNEEEHEENGQQDCSKACGQKRRKEDSRQEASS